MKKRYFEVECGDWHEHQVVAKNHEKAVNKVLLGKNPKTLATLARVREDHPKQSRRIWFYINAITKKRGKDRRP